MPAPMMNDILPDLLEEMVYLLKQQGADPLEAKLRALESNRSAIAATRTARASRPPPK